jgi:HxlR-like helix-turn-helix protein
VRRSSQPIAARHLDALPGDPARLGREQGGDDAGDVLAEVPPRVVYTVTKLGLSLRPIVGALCEWGRRHASELDAVERRAARK